MSAPSERYTTVAIVLHWIIAIAIVGMLMGGWYMTNLPDGAPGQYDLYQFHKSLGITILLLTVARIIWRVMNPPPALPGDMKGWEKSLSHLVHIGVYLLMIALPLTGWLYSSVSLKLDVPTVLYGVISWPDMPFVEGLKTEAGAGAANRAHGMLGFLAVALIALHIGGAIKHEFGAEDGVIKRMAPGLFGPDNVFAKPSRGALTAFGSAFALLVVIAGAGPAMSALSGAGAPVASGATFEPNWAVDADASSIRFSGIHDGNEFSGQFGNWDAAIQFEPTAPENAEVRVTVSTASATANQKLYTDSLPSGEWFNTAAFPTASVDILDIASGGDGTYTSTARLTLKDLTVDAAFPFELQIDGDRAQMTGQAVFQRTPLDLGQASDPGADWVSEDITVNVVVEADRLN
ncbi:MAG: cytochrome b/b6 domain-containing protein [Hyphomonadaceae bacterium]|nr:cytochrome b/b6 domain-containing protein [Hyphomonadaceae bacterium]